MNIEMTPESRFSPLQTSGAQIVGRDQFLWVAIVNEIYLTEEKYVFLQHVSGTSKIVE